MSKSFYYFFDMDGTLCDSEEIYALALQATIREMTGVDIAYEEASSHSLGRSVNDVMDFVFTHFNIDSNMRGTFYAIMLKQYSDLKTEKAEKFLISPTVSLFRQLVAEGQPVCIVSGASRDDISAVLKLINLDKPIPYFGNEDYRRGKPHPEPYLTAAQYFNIPDDQHENIIVFEDSPVGVRSGRAAGMYVVGLQSSQMACSLYDEGAHIVFAKKDIGAETGHIATVDFVTAIREHLSEIVSQERRSFSFS